MIQEYNSLLFQDVDRPIMERINDLLQRLTVEEKIGFLSVHQSGVERFNIRDFTIGQEVARGYVDHNEPSTVFPQAIGMASTFDPKLMYQIGEIASTQARIYYNKYKDGRVILWGPTVDLCRDPRWGRNGEAYGEDPYLAGIMSQYYTLGMKGEHPTYWRAIPTLKHFCANNNETDRMNCNANLDEYSKMNYYYEAFRPAIEQGGAYSVMASYNEINGIPGLLNPDMKEILKQKWGLGFIVTDQDDFVDNVNEHNYTDDYAETLAYALCAGVDVFNDDKKIVEEAARVALSQGLITIGDIDRAIGATLKARFLLGEFDPPERNPYTNINEELLERDEYKKINLQAVCEGFVLLKNSGILPLDKKKVKKVAVIGPHANKSMRDWYTGMSSYSTDIIEELGKILGKENVLVEEGYDYVSLLALGSNRYLKTSMEHKVSADAKLVERQNIIERMDWDENQINYRFVESKNYLENGYDWKADRQEIYEWFMPNLFVEEEVSAEELYRYGLINLQQAKEDNIRYFMYKDYIGRDLLANSDGRLTIDWMKQPHKLQREKLFREEIVSKGTERVMKMAENVDIVILCVGNHPLFVGKEGRDRTSLDLPPHQRALIDAVYKVNKNIILCMISGYPYSIVEEDDMASAILYSSHAGPELGTGLAKVLFGDYNPAGRLPQTWYRSVRDLPQLKDYDIVHSQMTYQFFTGKPLYAFGYGLSYSKFQYARASILCQPNEVIVNVDIQNVSELDGDEVVQVYVSKKETRLLRPIRKLVGFLRLSIPAGATRTASIQIDNRQLTIWDTYQQRYVLEEGTYCFEIGSSSEQINLTIDQYVNGEIIREKELTIRTLTRYCDDYGGGCTLKYSRVQKEYYMSSTRWDNWLIFRNVRLDDIKYVEIEQAVSYRGDNTIQLMMDAPYDGVLLARIPVKVTAGPEDFIKSSSRLLVETKGVHDLYFVFGQGRSILSICLQKDDTK